MKNLSGRSNFRIPPTAGDMSRTAKLTSYQAKGIRTQADNGVPLNSLAALFGVSVDTVRLIYQRKTWRDV